MHTPATIAKTTSIENGGSMPVQQTKASQPPRAGQRQTTMLGNRSFFGIWSSGQFPPVLPLDRGVEQHKTEWYITSRPEFCSRYDGVMF